MLCVKLLRRVGYTYEDNESFVRLCRVGANGRVMACKCVRLWLGELLTKYCWLFS